MGPDRSVVIRHRIVTRLAGSDRPNSPTGEARFMGQCRSNTTRMLCGCDSGKKAMTRVRRADPAGLLPAIERKRVDGKLITPETLFESLAEDFGLLRQITRPCIIAEEFSQSGRRQLCCVNVALHFAQSDWSLGGSAVRVENCVVRVLPALINKPKFRSASIFHKAVAIDVAIMIDPCERPLHVRPN